MLNLNPSPEDFWFLPLGGTGEIGMNLNLYGHNGQWLMVDCGITFEDRADGQGFLQSRIEMPAIEAIRTHEINLVGLVITHAHEDHLGAVQHLWDQLGCPIYATPFSRNVLLSKFARSNCQAPIEVFQPDAEFSVGPFRIQSLSMTHSTLETQGLIIETPVSRIFHTADWKIDSDPVIGRGMQVDRIAQLKNIDAVVCDSTNALELEHAVSESTVRSGLLSAIKDAPGRVVVGCFASNIARLQTIGQIGKETHRHLGLLGYSMDNMTRCAKAAGYLVTDFKTFDAKELGYLPPQEVLIAATGSQGEPGAALHRLSLDTHPDLNLEPGDLVIMSAKTIPGNEKSVGLLIQRFLALGVDVLQADTSNLTLHASGHGGDPEIAQLYSWVQPKAAVPVHGEPKHLDANAAIAKRVGVPHQLVGRNGDLYDLRNMTVIASAVSTGRLTLDAYGRLVDAAYRDSSALKR
jgi:ribonuclease J